MSSRSQPLISSRSQPLREVNNPLSVVLSIISIQEQKRCFHGWRVEGLQLVGDALHVVEAINTQDHLNLQLAIVHFLESISGREDETNGEATEQNSQDGKSAENVPSSLAPSYPPTVPSNSWRSPRPADGRVDPAGPKSTKHCGSATQERPHHQSSSEIDWQSKWTLYAIIPRARNPLVDVPGHKLPLPWEIMPSCLLKVRHQWNNN